MDASQPEIRHASYSFITFSKGFPAYENGVENRREKKGDEEKEEKEQRGEMEEPANKKTKLPHNCRASRRGQQQAPLPSQVPTPRRQVHFAPQDEVRTIPLDVEPTPSSVRVLFEPETYNAMSDFHKVRACMRGIIFSRKPLEFTLQVSGHGIRISIPVLCGPAFEIGNCYLDVYCDATSPTLMLMTTNSADMYEWRRLCNASTERMQLKCRLTHSKGSIFHCWIVPPEVTWYRKHIESKLGWKDGKNSLDEKPRKRPEKEFGSNRLRKSGSSEARSGRRDRNGVCYCCKLGIGFSKG
ncbi:uncharacterized protein BDR25DRAFT_339179 [Lindgomyces ingoldianus]|uniref:Uncharacterized protein n=1 Tax=Lindgomyces ingoldianus TaxID=673940 RepID=A0ACB6RFC4_9PLEO|nr:uncharacterized protein BDR25DRAFT_339179 [Lindgomyces ingoldianus]KAF2477192.1 hypothetical protein BDR25DRAFT_339179 [Lindgomyces ingoldianus]